MAGSGCDEGNSSRFSGALQHFAAALQIPSSFSNGASNNFFE
jgi:hypothetical protein